MRKLIVLLLLCALLSGCSPYSTKISSLDCDFKLSFIVDIDDADGNDQYYLRTVDFASDAVTDVHLKGVKDGELVYGESLQDIRLRSYGDEDWRRIHKLGYDGSLSEESFVSWDYYGEYSGDKFAFEYGNDYDEFGLLNGKLRTRDDYYIGQLRIAEYFYNNYYSEILSYYPDGRILGYYTRDTEKTTVDYSYKDENGKEITVERPMTGYTLCTEDIQGNISTVMNFGEDTSIHKISHAGWINSENLLVIGWNAKNQSHFYRVNIPSGSAEIIKTSRGKPVEAYAVDNPSNSHISVSPDGCYVSYRATPGLTIAVDLRTGKRCSVHNGAFDEARVSEGDIQFWH